MKRLFSVLLILNMCCYKYVEYPVNKEIKSEQIKQEIKEDYLLILEIPKLKLNNKIYGLNNKKNNVNKNVELLKPFRPPTEENSIILLAGHNGNSNVSFFNKLYKLKLYDKLIISYKNKKYVYKIVNIYDVMKTGKVVIQKDNYSNILVLITCKGNDKQTIFVSSLIS